jgi:hypothetical protein
LIPTALRKLDLRWTWLTVILAIVHLTGCVSSQRFNALEAEHRELQERYQRLERLHREQQRIIILQDAELRSFSAQSAPPPQAK